MTTAIVPESSRSRATYEVFVFVISSIALFNTVLIVLSLVNPINVDVLVAINIVLALFFLADFAFRLVRAPSRPEYFFRGFGWADLLSGIPLPAFQLFRLSRLIRSARLLRRLGGRSVLRELNRNRAGSTLYFAITMALVLVEVASTSIVAVEASNPEANIKTASDAIWWSYVTITTVGYGDYYPVTNTGRLLGVLVMTIGVGLFGVLSGFLANAFLGNSKSNKDDMGDGKGTESTVSAPDDSQSQLATIKAMLDEQEKNVAVLRDYLMAMDAQMRQAGLVPGAATNPPD